MKYTAKDFAAAFGVTERELPPICRDFVAKRDFHYDLPDTRKRDEIILNVLRHIDSDAPTRVGFEREDLWERCWNENLEKFIGSEYELEALIPRFIKPDQPVRLNRSYVLPRDPAFELAYFQVCRAYYFQKYFAGMRSVYEFGCGNGFNLVALGRQMPAMKLFGLDWSPSACEMVNLIGKQHDLNMSGLRFDFFNPDQDMTLDSAGAVMTISALEQLGSRHGAFMEFLLEKRPALCLHMEPIEDLYDDSDLLDYLALQYHRKRSYLSGWLPRLKSLEEERKAKILEIRRLFFGSLYQEGYTFVVWRPV
ncbi:MAG: hypothetical protein OER43_10955 [Gammaproteobacteria bacterium]|nr:hypothetical protein [Gammaproteobacteria bacterium]MDH3411894.1 hypothetical protein [Gammaproteobacteria bacterium]